MNQPGLDVSGNIFNARDLRSQDVASRFVMPAAFSTLLENYHCVLEGPRGSGKTTLLRMLTPEAFALWRKAHPGASLGFIGVFVPADVRWSKQLEARLVDVSDPSIRSIIMQAAFSVATSLALLETVEDCVTKVVEFQEEHPQVFFPLPRSQEADLSRALSQLWGLNAPVPSISSLKLALRLRQHKIGAIASLLASGKPPLDVFETNDFLLSSWLDNVVTAVESINEVTSRRDQHWAILLDELEIVPPEILSVVVSALRSTSKLVKFKLALSPTGTDFIASNDTTAPTPDNDYRPIQLWYERREEARSFAERLFKEALRRFDPDWGESLSVTFGPNLIGGSIDDDGAEGVISNSAHRMRIDAFKSLYRKDESFRHLLDRKGIEAGSPPISDSSQNGTFVRKITPLVCLRDREVESYTFAGGSARKGGKRGMDAYFGYPNLVDLTEGNPRWVLTLADLVIAHARHRRLPLTSQGVQVAAIDDYVDQFVSKLTVYPTGRDISGRGWTLMRFLNLLGEALDESLYGRDFNSDPALSFTVDARSLAQYGDYIRLCIDLGALVLLRAGSSAPLSDSDSGKRLEGARVRLSYRLAPEYRLPLRATKERALSGALRGGELLEPAYPDAGTPEGFAVQSEPADEPAQRSLL